MKDKPSYQTQWFTNNLLFYAPSKKTQSCCHAGVWHTSTVTLTQEYKCKVPSADADVLQRAHLWFILELKPNHLFFSWQKAIGFCNLPGLWPVTLLLKDTRGLRKLPKKLLFHRSFQCLEVKGLLCYFSHYSCAPQYRFSGDALASGLLPGFYTSPRKHQRRNAKERERTDVFSRSRNNCTWLTWFLYPCAVMPRAFTVYPLFTLCEYGTEMRHILQLCGCWWQARSKTSVKDFQKSA